MRIELKGIVKVRAKGRDYFYAWRGGPRLRGEPGTPEFVANYNEAVAERNAPDTSRFRGVVTAYKASHDWQKLSATTQKKWAPWLDHIDDYFGDLSLAAFDRTDRIRPIIRRWRYRWAETPRTADMGMQVLSRVLSFAIDPLGKLCVNPCTGIKRLYAGGNRADVVWTEDDIIAFKQVASPEVSFAVDLAAHTGLRLSDLIRLSWSHVRDHAIVFATGKSRGRREVVIPLTAGLREVLARTPRRATTILTNTLHRPWTANGLDDAARTARDKSAIADRGLHWHDLRGTCATKLYIAGMPTRAIAEILGWEEEAVDRIIRKYVSRTAATEDVVRAIESRTKSAKPTAKLSL